MSLSQATPRNRQISGSLSSFCSPPLTLLLESGDEYLALVRDVPEVPTFGLPLFRVVFEIVYICFRASVLFPVIASAITSEKSRAPLPLEIVALHHLEENNPGSLDVTLFHSLGLLAFPLIGQACHQLIGSPLIMRQMDHHW